MSLKLIIFDIEAFRKGKGELKPVAIGYCICEPDFKLISYKQIILENEKDNTELVRPFIDELCELKDNKFILFSHNGGKFDNVFFSKFVNNPVTKINEYNHRIDRLQFNYKSKKFIFLDSLNFAQKPLKELCDIFEPEYGKLDFDIVDKSYQWYIDNQNSEDPKTNWELYLKHDVLSLQEILLQINSVIFNVKGKNLYHYDKFSDFMKDYFKFNDVEFKGGVDKNLIFEGKTNWLGKEKIFNNLNLMELNNELPFLLSKIGLPVNEDSYIDKNKVNLNKSSIIKAKVDFSKNKCLAEFMGIKFVNNKYEITEYFTNIDLNLFKNSGCKIEYLNGYYWKKSKSIYNDRINQFLKIENKNIKNFISYMMEININYNTIGYYYYFVNAKLRSKIINIINKKIGMENICALNNCQIFYKNISENNNFNCKFNIKEIKEILFLYYHSYYADFGNNVVCKHRFYNINNLNYLV